MATISPFKSIENKHYVYRDEDWMKNFCETLRDHAMNIVNSEKKKKKLLTKEQQEAHENANICRIFKDKFEDIYAGD